MSSASSMNSENVSCHLSLSGRRVRAAQRSAPGIGSMAATFQDCIHRAFPPEQPWALQELMEPACLRIGISKTLGFGIVVGSTLVKLPQVVKIIRAGNADGLSPTSISLELLANVAAFTYYARLGYAFSTWGENAFLLLQNIAIFVLCFYYTRRIGLQFLLIVASLTAVGYTLYFRLLPDILVPEIVCTELALPRCRITCEEVAGTLPILLSLGSRLPQIVQNIQQGHTGQLAFATYFLNTLGGAARVFTTMQELNDPLTLAAVIAALTQNAAIVMQIILYSGKAQAATKAKAL
eukprot:425128-Pleurochrysis_carterae.AAC.2